jgi:shikimate kinase
MWRVAIFSQLQTERTRYLDTSELKQLRATQAAACVVTGGGIFENQL